MVKFLTLLNIVAGAASIAGLFVSLQLEGRNYALAAAFTLAIVLCAYVLFAPGNAIEQNVAEKLQHFTNAMDGHRSAVQRGEFSIRDSGPASIQFHQPFAEAPVVKVTHKKGKSGRLPHIVQVSTLHAEFALGTYSPGTTQVFEWVAHGKALEPIQQTSTKNT